MDETYRMLGREHQADLDREAVKRRRADAVGRGRVVPEPGPDVVRSRRRALLVVARVTARVIRPARAEA